MPAPATRARRARTTVQGAGILAIVLGLLGLPVSLMGMLLSVNSCGAFGDHCTAYGKTDDSFALFLFLIPLSMIAVIGGIAVLLVCWLLWRP